MKKTIAVFLAVCLIFAAVPVTAYAAQTEASAGDAPTSGTTGDCTWSFDSENETLTVSGSGAMADYYDSTFVPWFQHSGKIKYLDIKEGVTHIGDSAFAYIGGINGVALPNSLQSIGTKAFSNTNIISLTVPENVTSIGVRAFLSCKKLSRVILPESLKTIGIMAFAGTALAGAEIPDPNAEIAAYAFGFDENGNKAENFTITGYLKSTAQTYANSNGFKLIDIEGQKYAIGISMGRTFKAVTGEPVTKAREGERIMIEKHPDPGFNLTGYTSDDVTIEEVDGKFFFTMPNHSVIIYLDGSVSKPIEFDLSNQNSVTIDSKKYVYLIFDSTILSPYKTSNPSDGTYLFDLDKNGSDDIMIERYKVTRLSTASVKNIVSIRKEGAEYSPVNFIFGGNKISNARLYLELPEAGSSYNYETDQADVTGYNDNYTVEKAKWFNEWGIAPERFEPGQKYFAEITLRPKDGYAFVANTFVVVETPGDTYGISATVYDLDSNGDLHIKTDAVYIPGEAHAIHITGGIASKQENIHDSNHSACEARAGERIWVSVGTGNIPEGEYAVPNTIKYKSNDVIFRGEAQQYFIMPDEDVSVEITYETRKQTDGVMDFSNGEPYRAQTSGVYSKYVNSQSYGIYVLLFNLSKNHKSEWDSESDKNIVKFDIDGDETFDVGNIDNEFFLLETSSLSSPSGQITLTFSHEESIFFPMRSLEIIFAKPTAKKHTITVNNGIATSVPGDWNGEHRIYRAYPGERVYLFPDVSTWNSGDYAQQLTFDATSKDVGVSTEGEITFVMPDKNVTVDLTYKKGTLTDGVLDLREGSYKAKSDGNYAASEDYGMYFILQELSARYKSDLDPETYAFNFKFDIDNHGGYDISYDSSTQVYSLLPENSLRPASGRITLMLPGSGYYTVPMHRLTILLAGDDENQTKHKITVKNGLASSEKDSYDYLITSEYQGQEVFVLTDTAAVPDGKYIISKTVTSADVTVDGESFVIPNRDVTVTVSYKLGDQKPFTLDFSDNDIITVTDSQAFNGISNCLTEFTKNPKTEYDSELYADVSFFDVNGDGKYDVRQCEKDKTFYLLHHSLEGIISLSGNPAQNVNARYCPLTVIFSTPLKGDLNGDGKVNITDATLLQRHLADYSGYKLDTSNPNVLYAADVNSDGKINISDVTQIQRITAQIH